ncbi:restriction endonuclease subunit S [uncultured Pseudodesulfovibrio sp.]|uniref:restriction endonuclease subunit S n=1 Tax=uncultured Pseudodesulfovibrio sp. TaxID=2035858 RepID=UPI0029C6B0B9|nr:restriction endonuclease subunit S [uncultured Pseudodesulfovibrio sp.]
MEIDELSLPPGWVRCRLADVSDKLQYGWTTKAADYGNVKLLRTTDISSGDVNWSTVPFCEKEPEDISKYLLNDGDIVVSRAGSVGKSFLISKPQHSVFASYLVRIICHIDNKFLYYFMQSQEYWENISDNTAGIAVPNVNASKLAAIELSLPPLNEQNRIVDKIEELFSELDEGVENLTKAKEQLGVYRQSLLKNAFEGKITEEWRKENADKLESGEALLKRVKKEREAYFNEQLEQWEKDVSQWEADGKPGKKPTKPRKPKKLDPISEDELKELPELPDGWGWERLGYMTCGVEYGTSSKSNKTGKYPVLRMGNIQDGVFNYDDLVYTDNEEEYFKYKLESGDVLFNRTNSPELVGKTAVFREDFQALFAGYLIRVNHINSVISSDYLNFFLNSPIAKNRGDKVKSDGVNQSNINGAKLAEYPFPYCSLEEQEKAASFLLDRISSSVESELEIEVRLKQCEALRKSILEKAFSGKLVSQNPNDEHASKLLEKIKSERKNAPKPKRTRKVKKKSKRITMADLKKVLATAEDWVSAQDAFRQCGVGDEAPTDKIEKLYEELKQELDKKVIEVERRGDEDWLRLSNEG